MIKYLSKPGGNILVISAETALKCKSWHGFRVSDGTSGHQLAWFQNAEALIHKYKELCQIDMRTALA